MPCSSFCRSRWWQLVFEYFPVILYQQVDHQTTPSNTIIVSCHPHGVMAVSRILLYGFLWETLFPHYEKVRSLHYGLCNNFTFFCWQRRALAARPLFYLPVCREFALWSGGIDACRYSALTCLRNGKRYFLYFACRTKYIYMYMFLIVFLYFLEVVKKYL